MAIVKTPLGKLQEIPEPVFYLNEEWYIRKLDPKNWTVSRLCKNEAKDGSIYFTEKHEAYYFDIESAYKGAMKIIPTHANSNKELLEIVKYLENITKRICK